MCPESTTKKGARGEEVALRYLKAKGYRILDRNYRTRSGEIDIIAKDHGTVVFIEVKASTGSGFDSPLAWVTPLKQQRIARVSRAYLTVNRLNDAQARYDVVAVDHSGRVCHVEDAFRPESEFPL